MIERVAGASTSRRPRHIVGAGSFTVAPLEPANVESELQAALGDAYILEGEFARGGMSCLFLATDTVLHRKVVVKLLSPDLSGEVSAARFEREIAVAAHLQHPHILPIHTAGSRGRLLYYVMPYVPGESLRHRLAREGRLAIDDAVGILCDIADAVAYAHGEGVIHRDIKPENILLQGGRAVLADFGVARALNEAARGERLTATGLGVGTRGYAAPEQMAGDAIDERSDIFALGVVGYEMLAGTCPFAHQSPFVATLKDVREVRSDVPHAVSAAIARSLALDPSGRFETARDFARALGARSGGARVGRGWGWAAMAVGVILVVILVAGALTRRLAPRGLAQASIAVLPFRNMSDDRANEYFSDGMTDELTSALTRIPHLSVAARSSAFVFKGKNVTPRAAGESLHVSTVLESSVFRADSELRVVTTLVDTRTGRTIWSETYNREWRNVLTLQAQIADRIAGQLRGQLVSTDRASLDARQTASPEAYDNYLKGRFFFNQRTAAALEKAATYFRQALAIDSGYARAYSGLADSYSLLATLGRPPREMFPLARAAADRALVLDSMLSEAHTSRSIISTYYEWDWAKAAHESERAVALDSLSASAAYWSAWPALGHGRLDDILRATIRARDLEPLSTVYNTRIATVLTWQHRYRDAEAQLRTTLEFAPDFRSARAQLARVLILEGRPVDAINALPPRSGELLDYEQGIPGFVFARAGRPSDARAEIAALQTRPFVPADAIAVVCAGLGDKDAAFAWLEKAYETRAFALVFLRVDPLFDALHDDPRYGRLIARIYGP